MGKPTWTLTTLQGGQDPAYTSFVPPSFAGSMGTPLSVPSFMPTFTPSSSGLEVLASAALAQLPSAQGGGDVPSISSTDLANPGLLNIPGFASVPTKLIRRIWGLEYVDMWELLPETWRQEAAQASACCHSRRPKRGLITDIALWTECFTTLAAALSARYPDKAPHLMAYLRTIVRASRNFEGSAWASYDAAYRRQAANNRSLDWAIPDPALYNEAFTGRARVIPRCQFCLSDSHSSHDCTFGPDDSRHYQNRQPPPRRGAVRTQVAQICRLFNQPGGEPVPLQTVQVCTPMCPVQPATPSV